MRAKVGVHRLAEQAKVSIGTVDRALHGRPGISEKTRAKVLRIAQELGYEPNLAARALSRRRTHARIGVCVPREILHVFESVDRIAIEPASIPRSTARANKRDHSRGLLTFAMGIALRSRSDEKVLAERLNSFSARIAF